MVMTSATRNYTVALLVVAAVGVRTSTAAGAAIYRHKWGTVADVMGMHGQGASADPSGPKAGAQAFAAQHYGMITTAAQCTKAGAGSLSIEDGTLAVAARIKAANPAALVGMYWRTDMALEIAQCSNFSAELNSHGDDFYLRDDDGNLTRKHGDVMWDYLNKAGVALFARALVNVVSKTLPGSSAPALDYIFLDGPNWHDEPGISAARNQRIHQAKLAWFRELQEQFSALPHARNVILNSIDDVATAQLDSGTGVAGAMVDHWSILQFLVTDKQSCAQPANASQLCGHFDVMAMDALFGLVRSQLLANMTLQIKGWVGPVIAQQGKYPPQMHTPTPGLQRQQVMGARFNSELALFLLVAEDNMYWMYSWFWAFDSWVPGQPDSDVPPQFFPQAKCALGAPLAPPQRKPGTWTYTRRYEHARVFVDLRNRTACRVDFTGPC